MSIFFLNRIGIRNFNCICSNIEYRSGDSLEKSLEEIYLVRIIFYIINFETKFNILTVFLFFKNSNNDSRC